MTAPPLDPTGADRRLRLVYCVLPEGPLAARLGREAVERRLAACANRWPIGSTYWWAGRVEEAREEALLLKCSAKKIGALFAFLAEHHPYEVPDLLEIHVPRAHEPYVAWLLAAIDPDSAEPPDRPGGGATRRGARRGRAARSPPRTRGPPRRR